MSFNGNRLSLTGLKLLFFYFSSSLFSALPSRRTKLRTRTLNIECKSERIAEENPTKREKIFIPFISFFLQSLNERLERRERKENRENTTRDMKVKLLRKQRETKTKKRYKFHSVNIYGFSVLLCHECVSLYVCAWVMCAFSFPLFLFKPSTLSYQCLTPFVNHPLFFKSMIVRGKKCFSPFIIFLYFFLLFSL